MSLFDLSGRVAIVTGGNGGIGLGMAEGLASPGAFLLVSRTRAASQRGISCASRPVKSTARLNLAQRRQSVYDYCSHRGVR